MKRVRGDEAASAAAAPATAPAAAADAEAARKRNVETVAKALPRLEKAMMRKPKFAAGAKLMARLVQGMDASSAPAVAAVIERVRAHHGDSLTDAKWAEKELAAVCKALHERVDEFPADLRDRVVGWHLLHTLQPALRRTDDPFVFNTAMREVHARVDELCAAPVPRSDWPVAKEGIAACAEAAVSRYPLQWARAACRQTITHAGRHRPKFPDALQRRLSAVATRLHELMTAPPKTASAWLKSDATGGTHPALTVNATKNVMRRQ